MKKMLMATAALALTATTAFAERYVMITHTQGTDPFCQLLKKVVVMQQQQSVPTLNTTLTHQVTCLAWQS